MKILQLNAWTGRIKGALLEYLRNNKFDVICLQEAVWGDNRELLEVFFDSMEQIKEASGLEHEFRSMNWEIEAFGGKKMHQGIVILSREKMMSKEEREVYPGALNITCPEEAEKHLYKAQMIQLESGINIVNYHGYWLRNPLGDGETVKAMKNVAEMIKTATGPIVMCGDLNITHESPAMREIDFLRDLTYENRIDNTLSRLKFTGEVPCDHILVSNDVRVEKFWVEDRTISDHKGLIAEISY